MRSQRPLRQSCVVLPTPAAGRVLPSRGLQLHGRHLGRPGPCSGPGAAGRGRRQVMPEPGSCGRSSRWMPVCRTGRILHSTRRPGGCRRPGLRVLRGTAGNNGLVHSSAAPETTHDGDSHLPTIEHDPHPKRHNATMMINLLYRSHSRCGVPPRAQPPRSQHLRDQGKPRHRGPFDEPTSDRSSGTCSAARTSHGVDGGIHGRPFLVGQVTVPDLRRMVHHSSATRRLGHRYVTGALEPRGHPGSAGST